MKCALCDRDAEHLVGPDQTTPAGPWVGFCTDDARVVVDVLSGFAPLAALYAVERGRLAETEGWDGFWSVKADVPFRAGDVRRLHWYASREDHPDVLVQIEMVADDEDGE